MAFIGCGCESHSTKKSSQCVFKIFCNNVIVLFDGIRIKCNHWAYLLTVRFLWMCVREGMKIRVCDIKDGETLFKI